MHDSWLFNWVPLKIYSPHQVYLWPIIFVSLSNILYAYKFLENSFSLSKWLKICLFFHPVKHNSRPLGSVDQSKNYTGYAWKMCATLWCLFKMSNLNSLIFPVHKNQDIGKVSGISSVWIQFLIATFDDYFEILRSRNSEACASPLIFFYSIYFLVSRSNSWSKALDQLECRRSDLYIWLIIGT